MKSLDLFLSRLIPKVPGCPDSAAREALVDAAIEFCEETTLVQFTSEPQPVSAGIGVYDVDVPSQQVVAVTLKAWHGARRLVPAPADQIDDILAYVASAGTETAPQGDPRYFYEVSPGQVAIYPVPELALANGFSARIATKPTRDATALDDLLYTDWVEAIVAGAAARIHGTPGQSASSPAEAQLQRAKFWADVSKATNIALRGRIRSSIAVRGRPFV